MRAVRTFPAITFVAFGIALVMFAFPMPVCAQDETDAVTEDTPEDPDDSKAISTAFALSVSVHSSEGTKLQGAKVSITLMPEQTDHAERETDSEGVARFDETRAGSLKVLATKAGFVPTGELVELATDLSIGLTLSERAPPDVEEPPDDVLPPAGGPPSDAAP